MTIASRVITRSAKGVQHLPELVQGVLRSHPGVQFLVHDGSDDLCGGERGATSHCGWRWRALLHKGPLGSREWANLLDRIRVFIGVSIFARRSIV